MAGLTFLSFELATFPKSFSAKLAALLALYGAWGLCGISFLDSSFLSLPLVNDVLLIHAAGYSPGKAVMDAVGCTVGSVLGASTIYAIARGGGRVLGRRSPEKMLRARRWLERNDFAAVLVAALLPPPAPFKLFAISAGILRVDFLRFAMALIVGRSLRFGAGAWLGAHYGARAEGYLRENLGWSSLAIATTVVGVALLYRRVARRGSKAEARNSNVD